MNVRYWHKADIRVVRRTCLLLGVKRTWRRRWNLPKIQHPHPPGGRHEAPWQDERPVAQGRVA